jgi:imidazole glycerol phosphate synthase subunit HisF
VTLRLELLPAVDVADGLAVRLVQGEAGSETAYGDPMDAALIWQAAGAEWVHLVDLDAAFGRGSNAELLAKVVRTLDVRVELSGGIRDDASLRAAFGTGCARVNLGTAALEDPTGPGRRSRSSATGSPSGSTSAAPPSPPAAGRRTAATSGRPWPASTPTAAPATSSPT